MEAIVLAGGLGTRLRSVVAVLPKCMAPVADQPFLFYIFKYLEKNNFTHVILALGYKNEVIEDWVSQNNWSFKISVALESEPLGTGGAIKLALEQANEEQVLILNGDTFFEVDIARMYEFHYSKNAEISIALKSMEHFNRYGKVSVDENNRIIAFHEKQACDVGQVNGGTYLLNHQSNLLKQENEKFSFETDILQKHVGKSAIYGFNSNGYFIDIGIPEDYAKAQVDFKKT
ncbi:MAG: nucleotidyltransferase family protein [Paludibacter sp.]|nr:nucleotidyltransferase family protein [Paludibacter sp.]